MEAPMATNGYIMRDSLEGYEHENYVENKGGNNLTKCRIAVYDQSTLLVATRSPAWRISSERAPRKTMKPKQRARQHT